MALRENGGQTLKITSKNPKVLLIHSDELVKLCDKLPKVPNRVSEQFAHFTGLFFADYFCETPFIRWDFPIQLMPPTNHTFSFLAGIVDTLPDQSLWPSGEYKVML